MPTIFCTELRARESRRLTVLCELRQCALTAGTPGELGASIRLDHHDFHLGSRGARTVAR